jgi:hypothetical protein
LKRREVEELRELADRVAWNNHDKLLRSWVVEHSIAGDSHEVELVEGVLVMMEYHGFDRSDRRPKPEPQWTLHLWETLHYRVLQGVVDELRDVLPDDEAYEVALRTLERVPREDLSELALFLLYPFRTPRTLDWMEARSSALDASDNWAYLASVSEFNWRRAESWLGRGRPLSLIALDALSDMDGTSESPIVEEINPKLLEPEPFGWVAKILRDYAEVDRSPRVERAVKAILAKWPIIVGSP